MRRNTKKFKPNPSSSSRHNIRSSSVRDIIGDRRFNGQFSHVNPHRSEGTKKAKRMKVGDAEADDLPNLGQNASSSQCEAANEPRLSCGDFAAKTSEYAFFKKMKGTTSCNTNVLPKYRDNQLNNAQQSDHCIREDIIDVRKESIYPNSSLPVEKEQDDNHYSFHTPIYGSKNSEINNVIRDNGTTAQQITPDDHNWLSSSVNSKTKNSGNKGVFSTKRDKLRALIADKSLHDVNQVSPKGFDLVDVLMSRILPKDHENNCQDETNSKYKTSTLIHSHEANKRRSIESHNASYFDDDFPKSSERFLEWNPNYSDSSFVNHAPKSCFQYDNHYHSAAYKRNMIGSHHMSYMDDVFLTSSERLLEWNPDSIESCYVGYAPKSSIQYDSYHSEAYERRRINSRHMSMRPEDTDLLEWNPIDSGIRIPEFDEPKLVEQTRPLLLKWEDNNEKDEFQTTFSPSSTLKNNDYNFSIPKSTFTSSPPLSPCIDHFVTSSVVPYTPKHTMPLEDSRINEKEESFVFLFQSSDENEKNLMWDPDDLSEDRVKSYSFMDDEFDDERFDQIGYPLLLRDSSENESY